jgi:hypothetical protein
MPNLDVPVRSPTGLAWVVSAVSFIIAGELFYEMRKELPAELFHVEVSDGTLMIGAVLFGTLTAGSIAWLASLYVAPGRIALDMESGSLVREWRRFIWRHRVERPLEAWQVRIAYFTADHRQGGVFKRLELSCERLQEVLLFSDFGRGEEVSKALEAAADRFAAFHAEIERGDESGDDQRASAG